MITVCPKCGLKLIVTAADLRAARGFVRCGRCSNVFNALSALADEHPATTPAQLHPDEASNTDSPPLSEAASAAQQEPPAPRKPAESEASTEEITLEFEATATDLESIFVDPPRGNDAPSGAFESPALSGSEPLPEGEDARLDAASIDGEIKVLAVQLPTTAAPESAFASIVAPTPATAANAEAAATSPAHAQTDRSPQDEGRTALDEADAFSSESSGRHGDPVFGIEEARTHPRRALVAWSVASALLLVLLAVQLAHHYRSELAAQPRLLRPLTAVYHMLGMSLVPRWDLDAYEVRQLGAIVERGSPGLLAVRVSLGNRAQRAQPLPLLRVTMLDRYGNRVAERDVPPAAYAVAGTAQSDHLGAGQRVDAQIRFVDPGQHAVGFEVDACLPAPEGGIACANERHVR